MSMAFTLASKLSPSTLFLFAPSPPKLPQVPTLAELQKQAMGIQQSFQESLPTYSFRPPSSSTQAKSIDVTEGRAEKGDTVKVLTGGSLPPSYPGKEARNETVMGKLRKPKSWRRIRDDTPGEGPKMDGSSVYAQSVKAERETQQEIDELGQTYAESKWWSCLLCRG